MPRKPRQLPAQNTLPYLLLTLTALCGEYPIRQISHLPGGSAYLESVVTALRRDGLLRTFSKDGLRGLRLTSSAKRLLLADAPEWFSAYLTGSSEPNKLKSEIPRRLRLHRMAEILTIMHNADIPAFPWEKAPFSAASQSAAIPAYYTSREVKEIGPQGAKIKSSRATGILLTDGGIFLTYNTAKAQMKWEYKAELRFKALLHTEGVMPDAEISGIVFGSTMEQLSILTQPDAHSYFLLDGSFPHFYYLTNDRYGEAILRLLCDTQQRRTLDAILADGLHEGIPNWRVENDAIDSEGNPVLFAYLLDDTPQTVKVKSNEVVTVEFRNQPKGNLIIVKQDSVTKEPLEGVEFKIVYADGSYVDAAGGTLSSTGLYRTDKAGKISISGISGTIVATEVKSIPGYTIDENTRSQTVVVRPNDTQTLHFYNTPVGGVEIIKVNEDDHSERIPNTTFEIRKVDDALVDTVTTDKNGRVFVALEDGSYYAKEVTSNKSFRLDDTPHYFEIKDGKRVTLQVTNKKLSGIVIHKIDSATGEGIYGVKFVLYDANKKPIGEYTSDDEGYIYIDEIPGGLSGRFYLRELEAAPGYTLDKQYKTVYVSPGKTVEIEWENTAVTGQIQIYKYAAEYNEVTGIAAGTPLKGAVYEIVNARSGKVVDHITTDARGVAASKPLPLTRYQIREVTAPAYWQLDPTVHDVTLEYPGQIIKLSAYDKPASLGVTITKRGNAQVMAGQSMRYDLTVANTSNVPLESFFWHDKIPYDVARPTTLTTGTYSARLNYRVLYKTNYNTSYQVLASNLLTSNNYSFSLNAIPMQAGEVVTDIYFDFGKVPVGFQSVVNPTLSVMVNGNAVNGYQMVNRADVGGKYQGTWQTATASWVTIIRRLWNTPTLPKTGY